MYTLAITIEVIIGILLMLAVLMQSSKGGGLAGSFGGANLGTVFGVRRTSDFLTKLTQWLAGIFMILALVINLWLLPRGEQRRRALFNLDLLRQHYHQRNRLHQLQFRVANNTFAPMAQLVEQLTLNQWVPGSSPGGCTN